jgi:5-methyltetrahydropteroyltriglutamate--homocysteine methyltransferase
MSDLAPVNKHHHTPSDSFDGGELDCGSGLLLMIRKHIDCLDSGELLEVNSLESSVEVDLPAWCRLTKNELVSWIKHGDRRSFLICKGKFEGNKSGDSRSNEATDGVRKNKPAFPSSASTPSAVQSAPSAPASSSPPFSSVTSLRGADDSAFSSTDAGKSSPFNFPVSAIAPAPAPRIQPLAVMGIGSWPRPRWLLESLHEWLRGRIDDTSFHSTADDAVRLAVDSQLRAGVDVVTDGEQRRDNYASFVGRILDNCQLIPLTDLLPMVNEPEKFESELNSLDVPADKVRHPVVFGRLSRSRPLAVAEAHFVKTLTEKPIKVALPGPYLLTRTMWLDCILDRAYQSREELAEDLVRILREEIADLLAEGVCLIQLDEPVLTEVVFGSAKQKRSFMCGALSERGTTDRELDFACTLLNKVTHGFPMERLALHICRGNWSPDESVALSGSYDPLIPLLRSVHVGTVFLEFCTIRAGEIAIISELPPEMRIGVGLINQKNPKVESIEEVIYKAKAAKKIIGADRLLLTPDCGFATFADNPVASNDIAIAKLKNLVAAAHVLRQES